VAATTASWPRSQIPNALTVGRILAIPVFVVLILESDHGYSWAAAIVFAAAAITDQIDGFLARRWHVESAFGKIADPLADRILIDVALVLLWYAGRLPAVALLLVVRDVVVVSATPLLLRRGYKFEVNAVGKLATWLLYASLALVMIVHANWPQVIFWAGFVLSVVSLVLYVRTVRDEGYLPGRARDRPGGRRRTDARRGTRA
jgi:CDP-diacylglycerol--glycerol-3-phosphate 3-phosphatidyltransferase